MVRRLTLLATLVVFSVLLFQFFLFIDAAPTHHNRNRHNKGSRAPVNRQKLSKKDQQAIQALYNRGMVEGDILVRRKPGSKPRPKVSAVDSDRVSNIFFIFFSFCQLTHFSPPPIQTSSEMPSTPTSTPGQMASSLTQLTETSPARLSWFRRRWARFSDTPASSSAPRPPMTSSTSASSRAKGQFINLIKIYQN